MRCVSSPPPPPIRAVRASSQASRAAGASRDVAGGCAAGGCVEVHEQGGRVGARVQAAGGCGMHPQIRHA